MFSKLSIRAKIIAVVSLLIAALAGMGLLAAKELQAINGNTVEIATNWLPSVRMLGELKTGVVSYRATMRAHLIAETIEEKAAVEKTLQAIVESNATIRKTYGPMISSPEERALYQDFAKRWQD